MDSKDRKKILVDLLKPLVLRRLKRDVLTDLPNKTELMIFHDLSKIQKELYKAILTKNRCKILVLNRETGRVTFDVAF